LGARFEATARSIVTLLLLTALAGAAEPASASASEWWYVAHDAGRVLFVDRQSISREGAVVRYSALLALHDAGGPAGETKSFMLADCRAQTIGWLGMAQYDRKDIQGDVSTRGDADAEMTKPDPATLDDAQLRFVCSAGSGASSAAFPIAIDEIAFADRLITSRGAMTDPRALHDAMAKDPRVPLLRSTPPDSKTFGTTQTVRRGEPLVPPRDYHKGTQVPRSADYDADTVGVIYDVAFQGLADGEVRFEVRGYSGDDMVHPGSGQTESVPIGAKTITIRDLSIAIVKATSDAVTYRVAIEKMPSQDVEPCMGPECDVVSVMSADDPPVAAQTRWK
jgi:hypothetical protein